MAAEPTATIDIAAQTIVEERIEEGWADLLQQGSMQSFRSHFRGLRATQIPYGDYILRVRVPGFRYHEQHLRVYQPTVSVRVGLSLSRMSDAEMAPLQVQGRVMPPPTAGTELWVKLVPVLTAGPTQDVRVKPDGMFHFAGFDPGEHLLLLIRGTRVLATRQHTLFGSKQKIELPLPAGSASP